MYNQAVVIINRLQGRRGDFTLHPTIIPKTHYQDMTGVKLADTGNITDTSGYVQIPFNNKGYLPPKEWQQLEDVTGNWTIQEHDLVRKGIDTDIEDVTDARTVQAVENVDYGLMIPKHLGVYLK